jgi:hypothetical protein
MIISSCEVNCEVRVKLSTFVNDIIRYNNRLLFSLPCELNTVESLHAPYSRIRTGIIIGSSEPELEPVGFRLFRALYRM